jgi:L-alanine-DL-glutamate epimerase-like enolase superfamily enzyme
MPAGAARNALDCALWDLAAKRAKTPAHELAGLPPPQATHHGLHDLAGAPDEMAAAPRKAGTARCSRSSSAAAGDPNAIAAVRRAVPEAELIVDANEGWTPPTSTKISPRARRPASP